MQKNILVVLIFLITSYSQVEAQTTINVTSHSASINGIVYDYSIGEMTMISTERASNLIVTQGILQPNSRTSKTDEVISKIDFVDFVKVYPNPTSNILFIELTDTENATFQLFDALGKILVDTKSIGMKSRIDLSAFAIGNYNLVVKNDTNQTQKMSFKILKKTK
jgi:hypothetical protein